MKNTEFEQFDSTMRKVLAVSREEMQRREKEWKRKHGKRRAKTSPASRVSNEKV